MVGGALWKNTPAGVSCSSLLPGSIESTTSCFRPCDYFTLRCSYLGGRESKLYRPLVQVRQEDSQLVTVHGVQDKSGVALSRVRVHMWHLTVFLTSVAMVQPESNIQITCSRPVALANDALSSCQLC